MGKKGKSQPHNSFYYFMVERQRQFERSGRHFAGGLRDVSTAVSAEWNAMSSADKEPYETMAQREKGRQGERYTTQGETYEEVDRRDREKVEREEAKLRAIKNYLIVKGRNTDLVDAPFYLLHANYHCQKENDFYIAEIAVANYSIRKGINQEDVYHTFVDFGCLPLGMAHKAQTRSVDTHMIPQPPLPSHLDPEFSKQALFHVLNTFGGETNDGVRPPFYTLLQFIQATEAMLGQLCLDLGYDSDHFRVFPLEDMFFQLKNFSLKPSTELLLVNGIVDSGFPYKSFSDAILHDDKYGYRPHISCKYHEDEDRVQHCSRSYVIRWGWHLSNNVCANMDIRMVLHHHCPGDTDLDACKVSRALNVTPEQMLAAQTASARATGFHEVAEDDQKWYMNPPRVHASTGAVSRGGRGFPLPSTQHEPNHVAARPGPVRPVTSPLKANPWTANSMPRETQDDVFQPLRKPKTQSKTMSYDIDEDIQGSQGGQGYGRGGLLDLYTKSAPVFKPSDFPAIGRAGGNQGMGRGGNPGMARSWNPGMGRGGNPGMGGDGLAQARGRVARPPSGPGHGIATPDADIEEMNRRASDFFIDPYAQYKDAEEED